ncbi:GMP/IMP nucleotidase [Aurantivibrio infirmus]
MTQKNQPTLIPWHAIDTVLLDMDGTLLDLHFDNYFWEKYLPEHYAAAHQVDLDEAQKVLRAHIKAHEGTLLWYCLEHWSESLQLNIIDLKQNLKHKIQIRPFAVEFLKWLRSQQKRLVLITNSHPLGLDLKLEITKIDQWLDLVISSHQFQYPKEEQEFWQLLKEKEDFDPKRTLFIDDTTRILKSASTFGIHHLLCIQQPDSQREREPIIDFPVINHFDEIFPQSTFDL